jgi:chromosome segregation ATPase
MALDLKKAFSKDKKLDKKSLEFLTKALERGNLPGFDYLEFKQSLEALHAMNMDESMAFQSAFATASTMGLTKDKLLKSVDHYQQVLKQEKQQFDEALQKQLHQRVEVQKAEIEKMKLRIQKAREQIKKLEEQIAKDQDALSKVDDRIQEATDKIKTTQQNFESTYQSLFQEMEEDKESIGRIL